MEFTTGQISEILSCKPTDIAQIGQIIPPDSPGRGKGNRSRYSFKNLVEIQIFRTLNQFGVPRKRIREYIDNLNKLRFPWLAEGGVGGWAALDNSWHWSAGSTPDDVIQIMLHSRPVDGVIVINLGQIKQFLRERIFDLYGDLRNGREYASVSRYEGIDRGEQSAEA